MGLIFADSVEVMVFPFMYCVCVLYLLIFIIRLNQAHIFLQDYIHKVNCGYRFVQNEIDFLHR